MSSLAFTSILGFAAIIYTVFFIVFRAMDGSYSVESGRFIVDGVLSAVPTFERTSLWNFGFTSLVLASNLGLAYIGKIIWCCCSRLLAVPWQLTASASRRANAYKFGIEKLTIMALISIEVSRIQILCCKYTIYM